MAFTNLLLDLILKKQQEDELSQNGIGQDFTSQLLSGLTSDYQRDQGILQQEQVVNNNRNSVSDVLMAMGKNPLNAPQQPTQLGFGLPSISQFTPFMNADRSFYNSQPIPGAMSDQDYYKNPMNFSQSNESLVNDFDQFMGLAENKIGNDSSNQIQSIIDDIRMQKSSLGSGEPDFKTKLIGSIISSVGGATGNQALAQQGFNLIEGAKQNKVQQKALLDQQEISARTLKYNNDLQKENTLRNSYTDVKMNAIKYSNTVAASKMSFDMQIYLTKKNAIIETNMKNNDSVRRLDEYAQKSLSDEIVRDIELMRQLTLDFGNDGKEIFTSMKTGKPLTPELNDMVKLYSKGSLSNRQLSLQEQATQERINANKREQNESAGVTSPIIPGSLSTTRSLENVPKNESKFRIAGTDKTYKEARSRQFAELQSSKGVLTSKLGSEVDNAIKQNADLNGVPPEILFAKLKAESDFNINVASQPNQKFAASDGRNAIGLSQITRDTAKTWGFDYERLQKDPVYAVESGAKMFGVLYKKNNQNLEATLINYNLGSEMNIKSVSIETGKFTVEQNGKLVTKDLPTETRVYIAKVNGIIDGYDKFGAELKGDPKLREAKIDQIIQNANREAKDFISVGKIRYKPGTTEPATELNNPTGKVLMDPYTPEERAAIKKNAFIKYAGLEGLDNDPFIKRQLMRADQEEGLIEQDSTIKEQSRLSIKSQIDSGVIPIEDVTKSILEASYLEDMDDVKRELLDYAVKYYEQRSSRTKVETNYNSSRNAGSRIADMFRDAVKDYNSTVKATKPTVQNIVDDSKPSIGRPAAPNRMMSAPPANSDFRQSIIDEYKNKPSIGRPAPSKPLSAYQQQLLDEYKNKPSIGRPR